MSHRPKGLLLRDGEPLVARQIRLLADAGVIDIAVGLGHHAAGFEPVLEALRSSLQPRVQLRCAVNPSPDDGPASTLCCALALLPADARAVLVLLADQPLLESQDVDFMLRAWRDRPTGVDLVLPVFSGQPGHPLVLGPSVRHAVEAGRGATGVRDWRRAHTERVLAVPVNHPRCTLDVDTEDDLARLSAEHGVRLTWPAFQS